MSPVLWYGDTIFKQYNCQCTVLQCSQGTINSTFYATDTV